MSKINLKRKTIAIIPIVLIVLGFVGLWVYKNRYTILQNELVQMGVPAYHSIRKIPDVLFIPFIVFAKSGLDQKYDIYISNDNVAKMNAALTDEPFAGTLEDKNKVWVDAQFRSGDYNENIKIRYRGQLANHWNSYQKSYLIKFPKDNLFNGMRELALIIPVDRKYLSTSLNNYRARKMGLIVPDEFYPRVTVNGANMGVYLAMEHWSQEFVEKQPISALSKIYGVEDIENFENLGEGYSVYSMDSLGRWKSWNSDVAEFPEIQTLISLLEGADDVTFERIAPTLLDLKAFYAQDTINLLTGGYHLSDDGNNLVLMFDVAEGRFKPIPFNAGLSEPGRRFQVNAPLLQKRIWGIPKFRLERDLYFDRYVRDNESDDNDFVRDWIDFMKREFIMDNAKLENNFMLFKSLKDARNYVAKFFELKTDILVGKVKAPEPTGKFEPTEEFKYLRDASKTPAEFVRANPNFWRNGNEIILSPGFHYFSRTTIIPRDSRLIIRPGATLAFAPGASLISYSPVEVVGNKWLPITFKPAQDGKSWGVFAVLNTDSQSNISHANFDGGSEAIINGVYISGMLAFHNADSVIDNSTFSNTKGDDGLNIKSSKVSVSDSIFRGNIQDGIDLDVVLDDSILENSFFENNGGDAIDLSWSTLPIRNVRISNCGDKGISVGERSNLQQLENISVDNCSIGVAVKDQSDIFIKDSSLTNNRVGVSLYQKKSWFGGATGTISNVLFEGNVDDFFTDENSSYEVE